MEDIILLGIGGHAHSVVDSIECAGKYRIVGFLDLEEKKGISYRGYKVLDADLQMEQYFLSGVGNAFVSIGCRDSCGKTCTEPSKRLVTPYLILWILRLS